MLNKVLRSTSASTSASAENIYIESVFSTYLYTGNGSTQTITNGINLSGKGGMVWIKSRAGATDHCINDTSRGTSYPWPVLVTNTSGAQAASGEGVYTFDSTGFTSGSGGAVNGAGHNYVSWTFRKAAKCFDVCTWTGSGANRTIAHNLGSVPGCIIVKRTDTTGDWQVYHRSLANTEYMVLNGTAAKATGTTRWNSTTPTSTEFSLGTDATVNASGGTYVAYLFAHDAGGFGDSGNDSVVSCGTFTGNTTVTLGWEPQWILIKPTSTTGDWDLHDSMRGWPVSGDARRLKANLSNAEDGTAQIFPNATGFSTSIGSATYIYIAIRRGPMKTPTDATKVFDVAAVTQAYNTSTPATSSITTDLFITGVRNAIHDTWVADRLRGAPQLLTNATDAEAGTNYYSFARQTGVGFGVLLMNSNPVFQYFFRRAPGFFDVVAYAGTGSARTVAHNLGVAPELMIVKTRSLGNWNVYSLATGATKYLNLNGTIAATVASDRWNNTSPTSSVFTAGTTTSINGENFIAYLFATCPGVSKCFSFTGNGTSQTINCGFVAGAKFVMIKRTDSTGNWLVADTARGIVSGNDPLLYLNSTAAEITTLDWIDPDNSGFIVNQEATANANVNGATYIGLAIA